LVMKKRVGVKFCGNCNPHVSTETIYRQIKESLGNNPYIEFLHWEEPQLDCLLVLSGCPADCANRPDFIGYEIVVAGKSVARTSCAMEIIADKVSGIIENLVYAQQE
jgi:hypothetical protein